MSLSNILPRLYPELTYFERNDQATEALTTARHRLFRKASFWIVTLFLCGGLFFLFGWLIRYYSLPQWLSHFVFPIIYVVWALAGYWLYWRAIRRSLRERLVELGVAMCLECGYDLRGSTDHCPECGTAIDR